MSSSLRKEPHAKRVKTQHQGVNDIDLKSLGLENMDIDLSNPTTMRLVQRIQKAEKQTKKEKALREGDDYKAMIRDQVPDCETDENDDLKLLFLRTLKKAEEPEFIAADDASKARSSHCDPDLCMEIWPVNVLQSKFHNRSDPKLFFQVQQGAIRDSSNERTVVKPPATAPLAHLVPASSTSSSLYHHVAIWVFGLRNPNYAPSFLQKLIHGSKPSQNPGDRVQGGGPHPRETPTRRANGTGLKHMACNKIRLAGQNEYFGKEPHLIIVPVLSLEQAKKWKGEGYHAIFMISAGNKKTGERVDELQSVAGAVELQDDGEVASKPEIDLARDLLTATLKGLAYALFERSETEGWVSELSNESRKELETLRGSPTVLAGEKLIKVPKDEGQDTMLVRKITFAPSLVALGNDGHPAPDPLLLAVKAAVNWSKFHGQKLLPAGEDDDSYSVMSESSIAAMEEYLAMREHHERASRDQEIMNMTIKIS